MRLIDADAMIADLLTVDPHFETMVHWCCTVVDAQPTVDAVEVIRCKDCKCFDSDMERCVDGDEHPTRPDAFCSWAERRSDE